MMDEENGAALDELFPIRETFHDFAGSKREFVITLGPHPNGFFLKAREQVSSESDAGYEFAAYSPVDPFFALGVLRDKIRKGLATRYLSHTDGMRGLGHDRLEGRVGFDGVVVDGEFISFDEFCSMLQAYEGFHISLEIADPYS